MPRVVRNFWAEVDVDGKETVMAGGPKNKEGGLTIKVLQRSKGDIAHAIDVRCFVKTDGKLCTQIKQDGKIITEFLTER